MCDKEKNNECRSDFDERAPRREGEGMRRHGCCGDRCERFKQFYSEASVGDKLMINLRSMSRTMHSHFEQKAGQKRILVMLSEEGTLTQRELTEQLGVRPGSASEILSKLENAGLITRTQNEADRRTVDVSLTEAGASVASESAQKHGGQHEQMFTCLTEEEQATLLSLLERIRANWQTRFPDSHGPHGPRGPHGPHGPRGPHGDGERRRGRPHGSHEAE